MHNASLNPIPATARTGALLAALALTVVSLAGGKAVAATAAVRVRDFGKRTDPTRDRWSLDPLDPGSKPGFVEIDAAHGASLKVPVRFPDSSQVWRKAKLVSFYRHTGRRPVIIERVQYQVYLPPDRLPPGARVQSRLLLTDKEGHWFEALGRMRLRMPTGEVVWQDATALRPGWNTIRVDLRESSTQVRARGHALRWSRFFLASVRGIGFSFQGDASFSGCLALDNITTWCTREDSGQAPLRVVDFRPGPARLGQYRKYEFSFNVNRPLLNPFRAAEIDIVAEFSGPGGKQRVPAFYYQDYRRTRLAAPPYQGRRDRYVPVGPACFKVRFTPRRPGRYRCRLRLRYNSPLGGPEQKLVTTSFSFSVTPRADRGFVRVSDKDPRYFEFENGEFFFPLGHSLRSPSDPRHVRMILRRDFHRFTAADLVAPGELLRELRAASRRPHGDARARVFAALPAAVRRLVTRADPKSRTALSPAQRQQLLDGLNAVVCDVSFFRKDELLAHAGAWEIMDTLEQARPRVETKRLTGRWLERRNRAMLELMFPRGLRRSVTADHGLRTYEKLLPRMHAAGLNCFEVWMCSWWLGLEWTSAWNNYRGLGKYNLVNAWRLDYLLQLAAANDMYMHLTIDNHGKAAQWDRHRPLQQAQYDHEFEFSPYNRQNRQDGGFLRYSIDLFSDKRAKDYYRDKLRYIAARYGFSPRIFGLELWSELDLVGHVKGRHRNIYASGNVRRWHQEMAKLLQGLDHGRHLLTTHYSGDYTVIDRNMVAQPFIRYITCDAYHERHQALLDMLVRTEKFSLPYRKPFMVTEYGGFAYAAPIESMAGDLYGGLWWSWMSRTAGAPLYWWFELVELEDYYRAYAAFARFVRGEDKRPGPGEARLVTGHCVWSGPGRRRSGGWPVRIILPGGGNADKTAVVTRPAAGCPLSALLLGNGRRFYAYVYDHKQLHRLPRARRHWRSYDKATLLIGNTPGDGFALGKGPYQVEVWDCWEGKVVQRKRVNPEPDSGALKIELPRFRVQAAIKIKAIDPVDAKNGSR